MKHIILLIGLFLSTLFVTNNNGQSIHFTDPTNGETIATAGFGSTETTIPVFLNYNATPSGNQQMYYIKLFAPNCNDDDNNDCVYQTNSEDGIPQWFYLFTGSYTWRVELWETYAGSGSFKVAEETITFYVKHTIKVSNNIGGGIVNIDGEQSSSGSDAYKITGDNLLLGAVDQSFGGNYYVWNQSGTNDSKWQRKPKGSQNYSNIQGGTPRNFNYTVASNDNGAEIRAVLKERFTITRNDSTELDGTLQNQGTFYIVEQNSGLISAPYTREINNKEYYFYKWQDGNTQPSRIITPTDNATYTAYYKALGYSTNQAGYEGNFQRKVTKPSNDNIYSVYKSLGKVWLERSPNNGQSWQIWNAFQPLSNSCEGTPAIDNFVWDAANDFAAVLIPIHNGVNYTFQIQFFRSITNIPYHTENIDVYYYNNAFFTPVIALTSNRILIVSNNGLNQNLDEGLIYFYGTIALEGNDNDIVIDWKEEGLIPGTNSNSKNPTIVADKNAGNVFHIAWEERNSIKYCKATGSGNNITFTNTETPSTSSGFKSNLYPSISLVNGNPILSWTAGGQRISDKIVAKENSFGAATDKAVIIKKTGEDWGDFQIVGNDVNYTNNNSVTSAYNNTVIVWSEGNTPQSKWVKRTNDSYSTPKNLSHSGIQTQVVSGSDYFDMKSIVFNNNQLPYYFSTTTTNFGIQDDGGGGGLNKLSGISDTVVTFGRAGIVNINGVDFVFNTGDIILADSTVSFIEKPDTIVYQTDEELSQYTKSETFELNSNSSFYFSNLYYVINDEFADTALTENDNVNFKAELVKAVNEEVVGVFDNIDYNLNSLDKYANIFYQVDCSGIEEGEYYLRIVTSVTTESTPQYSLANIMNETTDLEKIQFTQVNFSGNEQPFTYDLSQNFPNPFNPTTIINYQIPEDGFVTLKIYDILGREVTTLVNEHKTTGRYEVNFDASSLASGVYIYSIRVNDFVSSKKMVLLK